jgi:hypothetical protein
MTLRAVGPSTTITGGSLNNTSITNASVVFIPYTPTIGSVSGTLTTATGSGRYAKIGNLVAITISVTLTNIGSATGGITASLPTGLASPWVLAGREINISGAILQGYVNGTTCTISTATNGMPGGNGAGLLVSGCYEST